MAFTEAAVTALLDPAGTDKTVLITRYLPGTTFTDVYVTAINGYAGRSKWIQVDSTLTAAQAATAIQTAIT